MITLSPVLELSLLGVYDAGIPNNERIVLRPTERINLAQYGIFLCYSGNQSFVTPMHDNFFWFGEFVASPPSWIYVYTGPGNFREIDSASGKMHIAHWGRAYTVFHDPNIVPVVFKIESILVGQKVLPKTV